MCAVELRGRGPAAVDWRYRGCLLVVYYSHGPQRQIHATDATAVVVTPKANAIISCPLPCPVARNPPALGVGSDRSMLLEPSGSSSLLMCPIETDSHPSGYRTRCCHSRAWWRQIHALEAATLEVTTPMTGDFSTSIQQATLMWRRNRYRFRCRCRFRNQHI
uniref:Uncharacterized protein n=1 Tax=Oryza sativa subsp. japonica TaxID=39947 RepID=Q5VN45_ORYSJ|nr:hypothetical protein [Oryza sativa Japonica Group]